MKKTWRITNQNGETLRTETLPDGKEPKLETHKPVFMADGVTMLEAGWTETAQVIEIIDETADARAAVETMIVEVKAKAQSARLEVQGGPDVAAATLKRTRGATLTGTEKDAIIAAESIARTIDKEEVAVLKELEAALDTDGINLPDWAQN